MPGALKHPNRKWYTRFDVILFKNIKAIPEAITVITSVGKPSSYYRARC